MVYRDDRKVEEEGSQEDDSDTTLIPKSLLAGKDVKPGDKIMLEVVHSYNDELEVSYAHSKKPKADDNAGESASPEEGMEELAADA